MQNPLINTLVVNEHIELELTSATRAGEIFQLIDKNRPYLSEFLPWVLEMNNEDDVFQYLSVSEKKIQDQNEVSFLILYNKVPVGRIGLHHLNVLNRNAAIGYWLDREANGKGIVLESCARLIEFGFNTLELNRIEIKAASSNFKSQAIPKKLGFVSEGLLRQAEFVNGRFLDLLVFSQLRSEYGIKS